MTSIRQCLMLAAALIAGLGAGILVHDAITTAPEATRVPRSAGPSASPGRAFTEWYYADGRVNPDSIEPGQPAGDIRSPAREWIVLYNPGDRPARATLTFFFEQQAPRAVEKTVAPRTSTPVAVHEMPATVPPGLLYGARVRSDAPVIVQPSRGEYEPHNPVTEAMASFIAYPGPLGKRETRWMYADGLVLAGGGPLEEREWVTILNPNPSSARVRLRFDVAGESRSHSLDVPAERVRTVDLFRLDIFPKNQLAGVVLESSVPVVVEQVRRAYTRGVPVVASLWACLAHPAGDRE